jgi:hypothetical protein
LETWTEARGSAAPVNRALVNVHVTIMKAELRQILDEVQTVAAEYQMEVLRRLQKLMPTAQALVEGGHFESFLLFLLEEAVPSS